MPYEYSLHDSIQAIAPCDWDHLRRQDGNPVTDRRFILAVQRSMAGCAEFRYVIFRDASGEVAAGACLCIYTLDLALLAEGWAKRAAGVVKRLCPGALRLKLVFCGLPIPGHSFLWLLPGADARAILPALDGLLVKLAAEQRARCIVWREFAPAECRQLDALTALGYLRLPSLPMNCARPEYTDFEDFCVRGADRDRRYRLRRSRRKFARSGLRVVRMTGREGADRLFTDAVYRLYESVYQRAKSRLEKYPAALFRELACLMPDHTRFTFVLSGERIVGFTLAVFSDKVYRVMSIGFDHDLNRECDLYFNLNFETIDSAYRQGVSQILMGQTTDAVKREKLGCYQEPRAFYIKGTRPIASWFIRTRLGKFFSEPSALECGDSSPLSEVDDQRARS